MKGNMKVLAILLIMSFVVFTRPLLASEKPAAELNLKTINRYIEENPNDPNLYFVKGQILFEKNRIKKSIQLFDKVLNMYPEYDEAYYELARAYNALENHETALMNIETYLMKNPEDISALILKVEIHMVSIDFNQALSVVDQVMNHDKYNGKAYLLKGEINYELGEFDAAYADWQKSMDLGEVEAGIHLKYLYRPVW